jgi:hypothetical protein
MPRGNVEYVMELGTPGEELQLPSQATGQRGASSPYQARMAKIKADPQVHGEWVKAARFDKPESAIQSVASLRKKWGYDGAAYGWEFKAANDNEGVPSVWIKHDPAAITDDGEKLHLELVESRKRS